MDNKITIGVLIGNTHTSHPKGLIQGICDVAAGKDVNVRFFLGSQVSIFYSEMVGDRENFDYQYNTIYDYVLFANVDVLIIAYGSLCIFLEDTDKNAFLNRFGDIPYVLLEDVTEKPDGVHIIADNYDGIKKCVTHLVEEHHCRKICYLSGPKDNRDAEERLLGYRETMQKYGYPVTEDMIQYGFFSEHTEPQVEALFRAHPDLDAIVSANDEMTIGIYRYCESIGLTVGKDIAVTGFDNSDTALFAKPGLTSADQNSYYMGQIAFEKAVHVVRGMKEPAVRLPSECIVRQSCGCHAPDENADVSAVTSRLIEKELRDSLADSKRFEMMTHIGQSMMRDLMQENGDEEYFFTRAVTVLHMLGSKSVRFYTLESPMVYQIDGEWNCPSRIYLTAVYDKDKVTYYEPEMRPMMTQGKHLPVHGSKEATITMNFLLFECSKQYGVLELEIQPDSISYFNTIAQQIGMAMGFMEGKQLEIAIRQQLWEQNQVLGFVAVYDELTGVYNRRGIMEKLVEFNHNHIGKQAYLVIGDLDHLKMINDFYGHAEGDYSIQTVSGILKSELDERGMVGRIGGDEFVAAFLMSPDYNQSMFRTRVRDRCNAFNNSSDKPYYVNISLGILEFECDPSLKFQDLIKKADKDLYEDKKHRRSSVIK